MSAVQFYHPGKVIKYTLNALRLLSLCVYGCSLISVVVIFPYTLTKILQQEEEQTTT